MGDDAVVVLAIAAVVAVAGFSLWRSQVRQKAFAAWAQAAGWTYRASDPSLVDRWSGQPFDQGGRSRRATEVLSGTVTGATGRHEVTSFTYSYTKDSGSAANGSRSSTTYRHHVMVTPLPVPLPTLELTHDGLGARMAKLVGGQDIEFESEDFNRAWRVQSHQLKFAHDVVRPLLMERLMRADARSVSFRIEGDTLLVWDEGRSDLDRIGPYGFMMVAVVESIPRFVWQDHGYDPPITSSAREGL